MRYNGLVRMIKTFFILFVVIIIGQTKIVYGGFNGKPGSIGGVSPCKKGLYCWTHAYDEGDYFIGLRVSVVDNNGNWISSVKNYALSKVSKENANSSAYAINKLATESGYTLYYGTQNVLGNVYMTNAKMSGDLFDPNILFGDVDGDDSTSNFFKGGGDKFITWLKSGKYESSGTTNLQKMIEGTGYPCLVDSSSNPGLCSNMENHYALVEPMALFHLNGNFWLFTAYEAAKYLNDLYAIDSGNSVFTADGIYFRQLFDLFHLQNNFGSLIEGEGNSSASCGSNWTKCRNEIGRSGYPRSGFGVVAYNVSELSGYTCEQVLGELDAKYNSDWNTYRDVMNNFYNAIKNKISFSDGANHYGVVSSSCLNNDCKGLLVTTPEDWSTSCTANKVVIPPTYGPLTCNNSYQNVVENQNYPSIRVGQVNYSCSEKLDVRFPGSPITTVSGHILPLYLDESGLFSESKIKVECTYTRRVKLGSSFEQRIVNSYNAIPSKKTSIDNHVYSQNKLSVSIKKPIMTGLSSTAYNLDATTYTSLDASINRNLSYSNCETYSTLSGSVTYCNVTSNFTVNGNVKLNYNNSWSYENGTFGSVIETPSSIGTNSLIKASIYGLPLYMNATSGSHDVEIEHSFGNVYATKLTTTCPYVVRDYTCYDDGGTCKDNEEEEKSKGKPTYNFEGMKLAFRIIDTTNPFVTVDGNPRDTGTNWCYDKTYNSATGLISSKPTTSCAYNNPVVVGNIINRNNSYNKDSQESVYTITLNPEDIQKIRDYNDSHSYSDYEMICDADGKRCLSQFISNLNNITGRTTLTGKCGYSRLPGVWSEAMFNCI